MVPTTMVGKNAVQPVYHDILAFDELHIAYENVTDIAHIHQWKSRLWGLKIFS